ncbi:hypothetical protein [Comamonas sp. JNW]|jgi:hypothetical protein|uniref:hypothetical protein n=1 Tax=unclassified Comamonas TaxID=2638500 RepID=UPI000DE60775|nr:hypothetical protein [Comamonas sp. JNW]PWB18084.1 hypothetical protein DCO45_11820 [Comamonas sp. JNW]
MAKGEPLQLLALAAGIYLLLEASFHGVAWLLARIIDREARRRGQLTEPSRAHWQAIFYRLFAVLAVLMLSHWFSLGLNGPHAPRWQQWLLGAVIIATVLSVVMVSDAAIIQKLKKDSQPHFSNMQEMGLLYILRHLPAHRPWYFSAAYLPLARRINGGISLLAFLLLYLDLRVYQGG